MDNPKDDLVPAVKKLMLSNSVAAQQAAVRTYFHPEAGFLHPMCFVEPGPGSREKIAGIYEWYRDMSPDITAEIHSFVYDEPNNVAFLDVSQNFRIFVSPFKATPARLLVKVTMKKDETDGKHYIIMQEDFYQPEDIAHLTLPFLSSPITLVKRLTATACGYNAFAFALFRATLQQLLALVGIDKSKLADKVHRD